MNRVNIADFERRLADLVDLAEARGTIDLMRDGKIAARLIPADPSKQIIDIEALRTS